MQGRTKKLNLEPAGTHLKTIKALAFLASLGLLLTSCSGPRPLKGGKALTTHHPQGSFLQSLSQSDNPAQSSRQDQEVIKTRSYTLPSGSRLEQTSLPNTSFLPHSNTPPISVTLSAPMPVIEREETRARSELGASQKDTARELSARLSSFRSITWVGVGLFVLGLASLVWPPLKVIVGSVTTSAAIMLGGLTLLVLPTLVVGNELLILAGVGLTAGAWFLAHRHGQLRGLLNSKPATRAPEPGSEPSAAFPTKTKN
jgi:hypothetical protein